VRAVVACLDSCAIKGLAVMKTTELLKEDIALLRRLWKFPRVAIRKNRSGDKLILRFRVPCPAGTKERTEHSWTYSSWDAAEEAAERITAALDRGRMPLRGNDLFPPTLEEAAEQYRFTRIKTGVSEATLSADRVSIEILRGVVLRDIRSSAVRITELAPHHAVAFVEHLEATGRAKSTIQVRWTLAKQFWSWASTWYFGKHQVCPAPKMSIKRSVEDLAARHSPIPTFDMIGRAAPFLLGDAQLKGLRKHTPSNALWGKVFTLMWALGIRRSQACHLQWGNIDWENGRIQIVNGCKTASEAAMKRWLPAPTWLLKELSTWDRSALQVVSTMHKGQVQVGLDGNAQRKITHSANRVWRAIELPEVFYSKKPTHLVRKTFRTDIQRIAGKQFPFNSISLNELLEYQLGHSTGLVGVYTDMWSAFTDELHFIAKACPDVTAYAKGSCGASVGSGGLAAVPSGDIAV
jgi:integrase